MVLLLLVLAFTVAVSVFLRPAGDRLLRMMERGDESLAAAVSPFRPIAASTAKLEQWPGLASPCSGDGLPGYGRQVADHVLQIRPPASA